MTTVNIAELKNRLSAYLDYVQEGEEIIIRDRNRPIAKIVPLAGTEALDAEEMELVAGGRLRLPPAGDPTPQFWQKFWKLPRPRLSAKRAVAALVSERDED